MNEQSEDKNRSCMTRFAQYEERVRDITFDMVRELNTVPLNVIPVDIHALGFRLALAFQLGQGEYCPIAILQTSTSLRALIKEVGLTDKYTLKSQKHVPWLVKFNEGLIWSKLP